MTGEQKLYYPAAMILEIETAFGELDAKYPPDSPQGMSAPINGIAQDLLTKCWPQSPEIKQAMRLNQRKYETVSTQKTRRELKKFEQKIHELFDSVNELHAPAIELLNFHPQALDRLRLTLNTLGASARFACSSVPPGLKPDVGPKPDKRAERVTEITAFHYLHITGKLPSITNPTDTSKTRHQGEFVELLKRIFAILDVKANAEYQTKRVRAAMVNSRSKSG